MPETTNPSGEITTLQGAASAPNPEVENLRKQLSDAQAKISEQGKQLQEQVEYVRDADSIAQVIQADSKLQETLRDAYTKFYGGSVVSGGEKPSEQQEKKPTQTANDSVANSKVEQLAREVDGLKTTTRTSKIKEFEDSAGISGLPDEQKKEVRRKIEEYVNTFGQSVKTAPMESLGIILDKAHKAINVEKLVADGKQEAIADLYTNQSGSIPHMQGRRLEPETEGELTPKQIEYAKKFGVDLEKAKETMLNKDNEQERKSAAELKKEVRDRS